MNGFSLGVLSAGIALLLLAACGENPKQTGKTRICPDWSSNPVANYNNEDFSNFRCAYDNNLFVQLKNSGDYTHGTGNHRGGVGNRESAVMQNYYNGTGASSSSSSGGSSATSSSSSR